VLVLDNSSGLDLLPLSQSEALWIPFLNLLRKDFFPEGEGEDIVLLRCSDDGCTEQGWKHVHSDGTSFRSSRFSVNSLSKSFCRYIMRTRIGQASSANEEPAEYLHESLGTNVPSRTWLVHRSNSHPSRVQDFSHLLKGSPTTAMYFRMYHLATHRTRSQT
jgi:hypothetical protein